MQTLYSIPVNPNLIWDYRIDAKKAETESFFIWYLARVLTLGVARDIKQIPASLIRKYIKKITLPEAVEKFWKWYLPYVHSH